MKEKDVYKIKIRKKRQIKHRLLAYKGYSICLEWQAFSSLVLTAIERSSDMKTNMKWPIVYKISGYTKTIDLINYKI